MGNDILFALEIYGTGIVIATVMAGMIKGLTTIIRKNASNNKPN
jgi:hypothetical protein